MGTPDYDLDDILNEIINKNVGEDIKAKMDEIDKAKKSLKKEEPNTPVKVEEPKEDVKVFEPKKEEKKVEEPKPVKIEEPKAPVKPVKVEEEAKPAPKPVKTEEEAKPAPKPVKIEEEAKPPVKPPVKDSIDEPFFLESNTSSQSNEIDESVNLFELGGYETEKAPRSVRKERKKKSKKKWRKTSAGKICVSLILVLAIAIVGTGGYAAWYFNDILNNMTTQDPDAPSVTTTDEWKGMDEFYESFDTINENEYASSYRDMVKKWYYNGDPVSSSNVLNFMLIGEDTRGSEISDSGTRADSAIIASVNTQTSEIILTSILRDAYVWYETTPGDESTGRYGKINGAMAFGGVDCYINAVERMFKVNIDNYVIVNFTSFQKIIDSLGGVSVTVSAAEIREINNHPRTYGTVTLNSEPGEQLLNGEQALAYCRIRHIDSDNARADRQKTVLLSLFKKAKGASTMKLAELATTLMPYVKTGFTKKEILSIGQYALSHGWISYKTVTYTVPTNETNTDGTTLTTCKGGTYYGEWIWKVDCPLAAQILQKKIYGKTSISLAENRPNFSAISDY